MARVGMDSAQPDGFGVVTMDPFTGDWDPVVAASPIGWSVFEKDRAASLTHYGGLGSLVTAAAGSIEAVEPDTSALTYRLFDQSDEPFIMFHNVPSSRHRAMDSLAERRSLHGSPY